MKIPQSVRNQYSEIYARYVLLKDHVDRLVKGNKCDRWHYVSRIKELESYALKLETGREPHPHKPEDMFACTLVVENHSRISVAADEICKLFKLEFRRPATAGRTGLTPQSFSFEELRLYMSWTDDENLPPTGLDGLIFEVQIKTFLQHAWGIATHDLIYKADEASWGTSRVAYQVKAMLENAELSISEAKKLTTSTLLDRVDEQTATTSTVIRELRFRWSDPEMLPYDIQRLAQSVLYLKRCLRRSLLDIWQALDEATEKGLGTKQLNLSPYGAILEALIVKYGAPLFGSLGHEQNKLYIFVPLEIELPILATSIKKWLIRPS